MGSLQSSASFVERNDGITPREFFGSSLPWIFRGLAPGRPLLKRLDGISFSIQFHVTGSLGGDFWIALDKARGLEILTDTTRGAQISIEFPDTFLTNRNDFTETIMDGLLQAPPALSAGRIKSIRRRLSELDAIRGMMELQIIEGNSCDGQIVFRVRFNGASTPSFRISGDSQTILSILRGEMNPVQGFISGKFKLQGDIPFAMKLQRLMPV